MQGAPRYEIVDTIALGDFATVYRGRDRDLGREVAVKQIHPQFLADPRQLARYWQEAQLLASLQHQNIVTIYDLVRPKGWLILELMRGGSLKQAAEKGPIDLDFLRTALIDCLCGLQFLHSNGVIHGDVKPSNILIGPQNRFKLGDFGLARRASNEEGSLLKGTTKYMAPELLSPQFGAVGPASDLYSLGFAAYELICGAQFESLLPSLSTYGRDKQLAWMMWHSAADLKLPEIQRILEGVPEDLARVVQKLIVKDQSRRYQSAHEVLHDLGGSQQMGGPPPDAIAKTAEEMAALAARRKRRRLLIGALAAVLAAVLTVILLLPDRTPPEEKKVPPPTTGVITAVYDKEFRLAYESGEDRTAKERSLKNYDEVFINGQSKLFRDLRPGDKIEFVESRDRSGRIVTRLNASRPRVSEGFVKSIDPGNARIVLTVKEEGSGQQKDMEISIPPDLKKFVFNGKLQPQRPFQLNLLKVKDYVIVSHEALEKDESATELALEREVTTQGVVVGVLTDRATKGKVLKVTIAAGGQVREEDLPFGDRWDIKVNGQAAALPDDLQKGDVVSVQHATRIRAVDARRELEHAGTISHVDYPGRVLTLQGKDTKYAVGAAAKITLGDETVSFDDLRLGDLVRIEHQAVGGAGPGVISANAVAASRSPDPTRFALLIAGQSYDDRQLSPLQHPLADARLLAAALVARYRVPREQILSLEDASLVRLQGVADWLKKLGSDGKLLVYVTGHAYKDDQGNVYLAPKEFQIKQPAVTGLPLQWLVDQLEACPAREKLLLLDTCNTDQKAGAGAPPSTAEMLRTLKGPPGLAPLRTVTAIASCSEGQRGLPAADNTSGWFARCLADAYAGQADANRDNHLELNDEVFRYLKHSAAKVGGGKPSQTPVYFEPNNKPPRISAEAKDSLRKLAAVIRLSRIDVETLQGAIREFYRANELAEKEPEPRLLYGLLLVKAKDKLKNQATVFRDLENLKIEYPTLLVPGEGLVWLRFDKGACDAGVKELTELVQRVPKPKKPGDAYSQDMMELFAWAGQLREFAATAVPEAERASAEALAALDAAVSAHGPKAEKPYQDARDGSARTVAKYDELLAGTDDAAERLKYRTEKRQLNRYAKFPFDRLITRVLSGLDQ